MLHRHRYDQARVWCFSLVVVILVRVTTTECWQLGTLPLLLCWQWGTHMRVPELPLSITSAYSTGLVRCLGSSMRPALAAANTAAASSRSQLTADMWNLGLILCACKSEAGGRGVVGLTEGLGAVGHSQVTPMMQLYLCCCLQMAHLRGVCLGVRPIAWCGAAVLLQQHPR